jgi:signal transduction histidine kinase
LFVPRRPPPIDVTPFLRVRRLWFVNEYIVYIAVLAAAFARDYFLRYRARREEERLLLSVRDNGPGINGVGSATEGVGLRNTRARLEQLYGSDQSLLLRSPEEGGLIR